MSPGGNLRARRRQGRLRHMYRLSGGPQRNTVADYGQQRHRDCQHREKQQSRRHTGPESSDIRPLPDSAHTPRGYTMRWPY